MPASKKPRRRLTLSGDIETERLRAAPTPGAGDDNTDGLLRAHTPGSSLGGGTTGRKAARGARGQGPARSGSETASLLAPESLLRSDLRGKRHVAGGGLEGLLAEVGRGYVLAGLVGYVLASLRTGSWGFILCVAWLYAHPSVVLRCIAGWAICVRYQPLKVHLTPPHTHAHNPGWSTRVACS